MCETFFGTVTSWDAALTPHSQMLITGRNAGSTLTESSWPEQALGLQNHQKQHANSPEVFLLVWLLVTTSSAAGDLRPEPPVPSSTEQPGEGLAVPAGGARSALPDFLLHLFTSVWLRVSRGFWLPNSASDTAAWQESGSFRQVGRGGTRVLPSSLPLPLFSP